MSKWSEFIRGNFAGPVIQINNAKELQALQKLAKQNKLEGYEQFCKEGYKYSLHIIEINYDRLYPERKFEGWYRDTNHGRSFLVEYSYKGFCKDHLHAYDRSREDPDEWKIIQMKDIIKELEKK